jgi:vacuolar-type H+-ATPase subunit E/Vma4
MTITTNADPRVDGLRGDLDSVRTALFEDAVAQAEEMVAQASLDAEAAVADAERDTMAEIERALHRSELSAKAKADQALARATAEAHRDVLRAKELLRQRLIADTHRAALGLRRHPRYSELLDHLTSLARRQLGADAVIERDPDGRGGVVATANARSVDYSSVELADRALETIADEVAQLWT